MEKEIVLENSTHPHKMEADAIAKVHEDEQVLVLHIEGRGIIIHGEHGTLATESEHVAKYVQQEINPVTKKIQKAFD